MDAQLRRRIASTLFIVGFFALWEALCWLFHVSDIVLPKPSEIIVTMISNMPALWPHVLQTLYTTLIGFGLGIAIGIALGVAIGSSRLTPERGRPAIVSPCARPSARRAWITSTR